MKKGKLYSRHIGVYPVEKVYQTVISMVLAGIIFRWLVIYPTGAMDDLDIPFKSIEGALVVLAFLCCLNREICTFLVMLV